MLNLELKHYKKYVKNLQLDDFLKYYKKMNQNNK